MFVRRLAVLLVLFFSDLVVSSVYLPGSNAERLAHGLPPKRPISFGRITPGYSDLYKRKATPVTRT